MTKLFLIFFALSVHAQQPESTIKVRTNLIGDFIAAVTNDGRFFAIVCERNLVWANSADLIFPNDEGDVTANEYKGSARLTAPSKRSSYVPLAQEAVKVICNDPNGIYTLQITTVNKARIAILISEHSFEASSGRRYRGY